MREKKIHAFILFLVLFARAENADMVPQILLLSPSQGIALPGNSLKVEWEVKNFAMSEDGDKDVVVMVNGHVTHVSVSTTPLTKEKKALPHDKIR
jgi:hypothetical protein